MEIFSTSLNKAASVLDVELIKKQMAYLVQLMKKYELHDGGIVHGPVTQSDGMENGDKNLYPEKEISSKDDAAPSNNEKPPSAEANIRKPWSSFFKKNTLTEKGMTLSFVAPIIKDGVAVAKLDREDVIKMSKVWEFAVVMYVVGDAPTVLSLHKFIALAWKSIAKPVVYYHDDGYFIVKFRSEDDFNEVINTYPLAMEKISHY